MQTKTPNPALVTTAQPSTTAPSTSAQPQLNGNGDAGPSNPNGSSAQAMSAALMATEPTAPADRNRSNAIDRQIQDDSRKFKKECKILLLGE